MTRLPTMEHIEDLIYDWNREEDLPAPSKPIEFNDETLRDGLQSPSVDDPTVEQKVELLHIMDSLGIHAADIGLPGAGERPRADILRMTREIADHKLKIRPNVACRTLISDIAPAAEIVQEAGVPIDVCMFIGSSQIRRYTEDWTLEKMLQNTAEALDFCQKHDLETMYVTEDTTRAHPDTIRALYTAAMEHGARRLCVCDTVGHATPSGTRSVVSFVRKLADDFDPSIKIDWHGHRDRDLGIANCLAAITAGADRIHATALGIGERVGNAPMDLLLVNCRLLGWASNDLSRLPEYVQKAADAVGIAVPCNYPVLGEDAFETGTGVHASAVIKAFRKGDHRLADSVYSGVPASLVGLEQKIRIGPMSGRSNVVWVLEKMGLETTDEIVKRVLAAGKLSKRLLSEDQIRAAAEG